MAKSRNDRRVDSESQAQEVVVASHFGDFRDQWDALVAQQPLASPFLRSWWVEQACDNPVIVLLVQGNELLGGAAFESARIGVTKIAGIDLLLSPGQSRHLAPDHLDIVADPQHRDVVGRGVLTWLHRPGHRILDFDGLASNGILASAFQTHEIERVAAPFATIAEDFDDYIASRPGKVRSTIKRTTNRVVKAGSSFSVTSRASSDGEVDHALRDLHDLHDERWDEDSALSDSWDHLKEVLRAGILSGDAVLHRLINDNGTAVAAEIDFVVGDRLSFYQAGRLMDRHWRGVGSALRAHLLQQAHAQGVREYDLLRGEEPYKAEWSTNSRDVVRVRVGVGVSGVTTAKLLNTWKAASPKVQQLRESTRESFQRRREPHDEHPS